MTVRLWTFQSLARVTELDRAGRLVGEWAHTPAGSVRDSYVAMVAAMARAGIDTGGRPPMWAWGGCAGVALIDAESLLGGYGLAQGCATVEFDAPARLCLASQYGAWCDYQFAVFEAGTGELPMAWDVPTPIAERLVQVCLPELRVEWVRAVRPLPRQFDDEVDRAQQA